MKLGQKVKFKKYLRKKAGTYNLEQELGNEDEKMITVKETVELKKELQGMVCGVRVITYKRLIEYIVEPHGEWVSFSGDLTTSEYKQVFLIACDMRGFYRVPAEWLEVIEDEED